MGWAAAMVVGTVIAHSQSYTPTYELSVFGAHIVAYTAIWALLPNFLTSIALTLALRSVGARDTPTRLLPATATSWSRPAARPPCQKRPRAERRSAPAASPGRVE